MSVGLRRRTGGFALLAVLWVMVGISALGLAASLASRQAVAGARNRTDLTSAEWRAEGCIEHTRAVIAAALDETDGGVRGESDRWRYLDRTVRERSGLRQYRCETELRPAGATLNVNAADRVALVTVFTSLGLPVQTSDSLADALLDWRDHDELPRTRGAEQAWYERRGRHPPRNAPFAAAAELRRVRGMENLPGLERVLGVEPGRISLEHAPPAVLATVPGIGPEAVSRILEWRRRGLPVPDLAALAEELSSSGREMLRSHYSRAASLTTLDPDAWIVTSRALAGTPPVTAGLEIKVVRSAGRAVVLRRRSWIE